MQTPVKIAIAGGIGSGKSFVCNILRQWGYPVFDCDAEAKALMDSSDEIKQRIAQEISLDAVVCGKINRQRLAEIVFNDKAQLGKLNRIVHRAVRERFAQWVAEQSSSIVFVETAILHSSGMVGDVDAEWRITAPTELRIDRVVKRNGVSRQHVASRIASQAADETPATQPVPLVAIVNDGKCDLEAQLKAALGAVLHVAQ